jgi:hypothetical protein
VAERPELWLPGGLAWLVTVGWIVFIIGVARPPTIADLTFIGSGFYTSAAWPWNAIGVAGAIAIVALAAVLLGAAAEAVLLRGSRARGLDALRITVVTLACGVPAVAVLVGLLAAVAGIAVDEFNAPGDGGGPVLRIAIRVAPLIALVLLAAAAGGAAHAAASRRLATGAPVGSALLAAPRTLLRAGWPAAIQAIGLQLARIAYLVVAALILRVLWAPVADGLAGAGIEPATVLLLLGFVAIWLCVVLGGGALHATGSAAWTRVLGEALDDPAAGLHPTETSPHP